MPKSAAVDQYILKSAEFAQPLLIHLRTVVHFACPEVEETIKWGFPHFAYKSHNMCFMSAFKAHCAFGFWKDTQLEDKNGVLEVSDRSAMGNLGKITSFEDLPDEEILISLIQQAMKVIDEGKGKIKRAPKAPVELKVPQDFQEALKSNHTASQTFNAFSPSRRKDYVSWIEEAKTESTRQKRIETSIEWLSEGKSRMWKYEK